MTPFTATAIEAAGAPYAAISAAMHVSMTA
jgi:hypothetical protein